MITEELKKKTCCGIVLYNPEIEKLKKNVNALSRQVDKIICIDNCSKNQKEILTLLKSFDLHIQYINNEENFGIAKALNQILDFAYKNGYEWYLTMDQDSVCSETLIEEYAKIVNTSDDIAILSPFVLNNNKILFDEYVKLDLPEYEVINDPIGCITSAALNNTKKAKRIGGYMNNLFIDCVDVEFNIRLFQSGFKIIRVNSAYMFQSMGEGYKVPLISLLYKITKKDLFKHLQVTPVYSDIRLYYIARNSKYLWLKYGDLAGKRMTRRWIRGQFIYYFLTYPLSRNRVKMIKAIKNGKRDSLQMGD